MAKSAMPEPCERPLSDNIGSTLTRDLRCLGLDPAGEGVEVVHHVRIGAQAEAQLAGVGEHRHA